MSGIEALRLKRGWIISLGVLSVAAGLIALGQALVASGFFQRILVSSPKRQSAWAWPLFSGAIKQAYFDQERPLPGHRARHLTVGIYSALIAGICATTLLADLFLGELFRFRHDNCALTLLAVATLPLWHGLIPFPMEARLVARKVDEAGRPLASAATGSPAADLGPC